MGVAINEEAAIFLPHLFVFLFFFLQSNPITIEEESLLVNPL